MWFFPLLTLACNWFYGKRFRATHTLLSAREGEFTNGKTGKAAVKYGSDNSKIVTTNINGITTKKVYDSRGILRQLTSNDKSTGNTTIKKYDETNGNKGKRRPMWNQ